MTGSGSMVMPIGSYQLENLLSQQTQFIYFDLRSSESSMPHPLLATSRRLSPDEAISVAVNETPGRDYPVVLVCQDGVVSLQTAQRLEAMGFINLFVVRGGAQAL